MPENKDFYEIYSYGDRLYPGEKMSIEHSISFRSDKADISELSAMSPEELDFMREHSIVAEKKIFEDLRSAAGAWAEQASQTMLINRAIEYTKTPAVAHTANHWEKDGDNYENISNKVYKMNCHVYEQTRYDRETKSQIPVAWYVTWSVATNSPIHNHYGYSIAGQNRKRYTDKAAAYKYLEGRKKAYAHLFAEISPPIPQKYANNFRVNGQFLPGYTVECQEKENTAAAVPDSGIFAPKEKEPARKSLKKQLVELQKMQTEEKKQDGQPKLRGAER